MKMEARKAKLKILMENRQDKDRLMSFHNQIYDETSSIDSGRPCSPASNPGDEAIYDNLQY